MTICTIAGGFGTGYTLGNNRVGMDPETLRFSKLIILWGANTLTTNSHLWRSILTARRNGAFLVVIDPIRTRTAAAADCHLAPAPGTDAALALGLMNLVLTVVVEHFMTDTAEFADILLPATMQFEHADLLIAYGHIYVLWNEPAVAPPGECLPATEIFRRLAQTMGLDIPCLYDSDEEIARQILDTGHSSLEGITLEALKERGSMRLNYPDPFLPFAHGFSTPSGKLEFISERMAEAGLDPLAGYTPPYETAQRDTPLARQYPLALIAAADHYLLNSVFANVPAQMKRAGPPTICIHPEDAAARRVESGDTVRVFNDRGSFTAVADITDRVLKGVVASTKGRWPRHTKDSATVNATVDERDSDMGAGAVYHDNRVEVEKSLGSICVN